MNKFILFVQLLFIFGINCLPFSTPEECLKELNCNDELNCVASCYNVPAPDSNSIVKTADCQNGCVAKYPNNLPTDWANLNQCYLDCVQNNYFNTPAEYIAATTNNNNNNNNTNNNNNNSNIDASNQNNNNGLNQNGINGNVNTNNTINNGITNLNQTTTNNGQPINATDHLPNVYVENSFIPGYSWNQTFVTITLIFLVFIIFN